MSHSFRLLLFKGFFGSRIASKDEEGKNIAKNNPPTPLLKKETLIVWAGSLSPAQRPRGRGGRDEAGMDRHRIGG